MAVPCDRIESIEQRDRTGAAKLGLLADTHDAFVPWDRALSSISEALAGVDAILHGGDLTTPDAIEGLSKIAPVFGVRSQMDPPATAPRLVDGPRLIEVGEITIGLVNDLAAAPVEAEVGFELAFPKLAADQVGPELFGRPVDVVIFAGSHKPCIASAGGVLFVNPGSPSLAEETTVGILSLSGTTVTARIAAVPNPKAPPPNARGASRVLPGVLSMLRRRGR